MRDQALSSVRTPPLMVPGDIEYLAALALSTGLNILPPAVRVKAIRQMSWLAGMVLHKSNRGSVRRVRNHLRGLFDQGDDRRRDLEEMVHAQLVMSSWNALILHFLPSLRDEHMVHLVQVEGLHYLDELKKQSRPVLLLGAHYGVYGYAVAAALAARGYPTWLVGYGGSQAPPPQTSRWYNKFYWPRVQRLNERIRMIAIDPSQASQTELSRVLVDNESGMDIVYLLPDQYFVRDQDCFPGLVPVQFLSRTVYLDVSGIQTAKRLGVSVFTAIPASGAVRGKSGVPAQDAGLTPSKTGRGQCVLIEPMEWTSEGTLAADIAQDLQHYMSRLEQRLLAYPALWRDLRRPDLLLRMGVPESKESTDG
ncbi:MAG: hypothetical protein JXA89_27285 [Anaerolineae bacterium]|nr:hypothetical protein [Anaerolineae bacterium]